MSNNQRMVGKFVFGGAIMAGALTLLTVGCSGEGSEQPTAEAPAESSSSKLLAELTTSDGTQYSFLQTETGELALGIGADHALDVSEVVSKAPNLTALYETLSGKSAPESLRLADQHAARAAKTSLESSLASPALSSEFDPGQIATSKGVAHITQSLSAAEFQDMFCPAGWDFLYCWPNTGGNPWVQRYSSLLLGAMNATNCYTRFRYRYYDDGQWYTLVDRIASPGSYWYYYQYGSDRSRRFEILNNEGCGVRFAVYGSL